MKVCVIGLRGIPNVMGGIETHCEHLYPRLASLDDKLEIIVVGRSGYARPGEFSSVRVAALWAPRRKPLETLVHTPLAILYARFFLHPDVIHLHAIGPGFFTPFARLLGFRVVGTHHAQDYKREKFRFFGRLFLKTGEWMLARFANQVICVSKTIESDLARRNPGSKDRFVTIRNGAPPASVSNQPLEGQLSSLGLTPAGYILCVGRLDPSKAFQDVIRAFETARPKDLKLVIVGGSLGSDEYAAKLKASASDRIIFTGQLPASHVRTLYSNAALFVHPSHLEGFPLVVLEALAANAPILISDIAAHLEVGLDTECYYPMGDVQALATALATGSYESLRCARRSQILEENDWASIALRHRDILVRQARGRRNTRTPHPSTSGAVP